MCQYTKKDFNDASAYISSVIIRCENSQSKFSAGTPAHTLLANRIKALYISKALITDENIADKYTTQELKKALRPLSSIISKCEKAQAKFEEGNFNYSRLEKMIKAMDISKSLIEKQVAKRG